MQIEQDRPAPAPVVNPLHFTRPEAAASLSARVQSLRMPELDRNARVGWNRLPWMLCALLAASTGWLGYLVVASQTSPTQPANAVSSSDQTAAPAAIAKPAASTHTPAPALESKGYIIAAHQILVSPKVNGMVTRLDIEEGKRVKKGDILAEVEDVDYRTDYNRSVAEMELARQKLLELERGNRPEEIAQTKAQWQESEAQLTQLEADWKRMQELRRTNVATPSDFDQAQSKYRAMVRQVERLRFAHELMVAGPRVEKIDAARADFQTAQSTVEKAKWKLDNCLIRSPVTGTILKKNAEEGNLVNAIAFSGSVSLCELADLSDLEVDLTVQERDISRVFKGQKCKVRAEAYPDRVYEGYVSRLMPIADRAKGAVPVRVKLTVPREEEGVYLKPEMGAIVTFYGEAAGSKPKGALASVPEPRN